MCWCCADFGCSRIASVMCEVRFNVLGFVNMSPKTENLNKASFFSPLHVHQTSASPCPSSAQTAQKRWRDPFPPGWGQQSTSHSRPRPWHPAATAPKTGTLWTRSPNWAWNSRPLRTVNMTSWTVIQRGTSVWPCPQSGPSPGSPARWQRRSLRNCPCLLSTLRPPPTRPRPRSPTRWCGDPSRWESREKVWEN